jgi:hypothetical protein
MTYLAWSITVKRLTVYINVFRNKDICFSVIEPIAVKDMDFYHFDHLLSWESKKPTSEEMGY